MRKTFIIFVLLISRLVFAEDCRALSNAVENFTQMLSVCNAEAEKGNVDAQYNLGVLYFNGNRVKQDHQKALNLITKAANHNNIYAQYFLGTIYQNGAFVKQDYSEAFKWYSKAANSGNIYAQLALGDMYENGHGVAQNYAKAFEYYSKSARLDNLPAEYKLANLYKNGNGVTQNTQLAINWYTKAANAGYVFAQYALGDMYYNADGVKQDYRIAYKWYSLADKAGYYKAKQQLEIMQQKGQISIFDKPSNAELTIFILITAFATVFFGFLFLRSKRTGQPPVIFHSNITKTSKRLAIIIGALIILQVLLIINVAIFAALPKAVAIIKIVAKISSIIVGITYTLLYLNLDKIFTTKLARLYLFEFIIAIIIGALCGLSYVLFFELNITILPIIIMLFIAGFSVSFIMLMIVLYKNSLYYNKIAISTNNHLFAYSAFWIKIAAYTIPLFIGIIPLCIGRLLFLIACLSASTEYIVDE